MSLTPLPVTVKPMSSVTTIPQVNLQPVPENTQTPISTVLKSVNSTQKPVFPTSNPTTVSSIPIPVQGSNSTLNPSAASYHTPVPSSSSNSSSMLPHTPTSGKPSVDTLTSAWELFIRRYRAGSFTTVSKLLFVVNFHHAEYRAVSFLDQSFFPTYRKRFPLDFDVVILGPRRSLRYKVISNNTPRLGYYSYQSLWLAYHQLCVIESCSYEGFLYFNDDSYVDPTFLVTYDLTKSWTEPSRKVDTSNRWVRYYRKNKKGVRFLDAYRTAIKNLQKTEIGKKCHFENGTNLRKGFADFYYITKKDMPIYYELIPEMKRQNVFLEMAAPTVNWCFTHNFVINCNHGAMRNKLKCLHVHPVKIRNPKMQEYAMKRLYHLNMYETPIRSWYTVCSYSSFS